jgi:hypothetical protein
LLALKPDYAKGFGKSSVDMKPKSMAYVFSLILSPFSTIDVGFQTRAVIQPEREVLHQ